MSDERKSNAEVITVRGRTIADWLRIAMFGIQKQRSTTKENHAKDFDALLKCGVLSKWVHDDNYTILNPLILLNERIDSGDDIEWMEFYNICFIIENHVPEMNLYLLINVVDKKRDDEIKYFPLTQHCYNIRYKFGGIA